MYSVITPNPHLRLDEVGVPIAACMEMTVWQEKVTADNIEEMRELVRRASPPVDACPTSPKKTSSATTQELPHSSTAAEDRASVSATSLKTSTVLLPSMEWASSSIRKRWTSGTKSGCPGLEHSKRHDSERGEAYYQSQKKLFDQVYADRQSGPYC